MADPWVLLGGMPTLQAISNRQAIPGNETLIQDGKEKMCSNMKATLSMHTK